MAQSTIVSNRSGDVILRADLALETAEDVTDAVDAWCRVDPSREYKVRTTGLGHVAVLYDRGQAVACGRGAGSVNALAHALEEYGAQ